MDSQVITFTLSHDLDAVPVPAYPYYSLVARSLDAIAHHAEFVDAVVIPLDVYQNMVTRSMIDRTHYEADLQRGEFETFIGTPVQVAKR